MASFPVYRKYDHNRTFFKIISDEEFYELNILGKKYNLRHFKAKILPDRNLVYDMLHNHDPHWKTSSKEEFEERLAHCRANLEHF